MASPEKTSPLAEKKKGPYDLGKAIRKLFLGEKATEEKKVRDQINKVKKEVPTRARELSRKTTSSPARKMEAGPTGKIRLQPKAKEYTTEQVLTTALHKNMQLSAILHVDHENEGLKEKIYNKLGLNIKAVPMNSVEFANAVQEYQSIHKDEGLVVDGWIAYQGKTWNSIITNIQKSKINPLEEYKGPTNATHPVDEQKEEPGMVYYSMDGSITPESKNLKVLSLGEIKTIKELKNVTDLGLNIIGTNQNVDLRSVNSLRTISFLSISEANNFYPDMLPSGLERMYLSNMSVAEAKQIDFSKFTSLKKIRLSDPDGWKEYTPEGLKNN